MNNEVEVNATEKWVNLEDIAEHLSVSPHMDQRGQTSFLSCREKI